MVQISTVYQYQTKVGKVAQVLDPETMTYSQTIEEVLETRKIIVVDGVPFYHSTGSSEDNNEILSPTWRQHLWMPFFGVDDSTEKVGHLCKLGSLFNERDIHAFEAEVLSILGTLIQAEPALSESLRELVLEKYNVSKDHPIYLDDRMVLEALAAQLTRFGTFDALFLSMRMAPSSWENHALLTAFRNKIVQKMRHASVLSRDDLTPSLISELEVERTSPLLDLSHIKKLPFNATPEQHQEADRLAQPIQKTANEINQWLYTQVLQQHLSDERISRDHMRQTTKERMASLLSERSAAHAEMDAIQKILSLRLEQEMESFKRRKGITNDSELATLSRPDKARFEQIAELNRYIKHKAGFTLIDGEDRDYLEKHITCALSDEDIRTGKWKLRLYQNLYHAISECGAYHNTTINKYSMSDMLKINLLNLLTALIFPVALIKKATTGSFFFSPVGKTKEAVWDVSKQLEILLPTAQEEIHKERTEECDRQIVAATLLRN